jgi:hypothetical protein
MMWASNAPVKEIFANRFERKGDAYVFRANFGAAGYRVGADDRDRMLAEFGRRLDWLTWGASALIVLVGVGLTWVASGPSDDARGAIICSLLGVSLGSYLIPFCWLWNAPVRELRGRVQVSEGRTKAEAKRLAFERLTWRNLGVGVVVAAVLLWWASADGNLLVGWNRLWLVGAGALLLMIAVQAFRKWRSGRSE